MSTPKFGDTIINKMASFDNPRRYGFFVRVIRRRGFLNPGVWWECTDGLGSFWQTRSESCEVEHPPCDCDECTYGPRAFGG